MYMYMYNLLLHRFVSLCPHHVGVLLSCTECDQSQTRMLEILDDRGLSFMFPLLRVQADLTRQLTSADAGANSGSGLYKWIKETYSTSVLADPGFIHILFPT